MKKRIIGFLLVVVMLALTLASCGYNYSKDDLSQYGSFNKAAFEEALKAITIADGDFTEDPTIREQKVYDAIYAEFATKAGTTDKKTEGKVGIHDTLYYCYYVTATDAAGVDHLFVTDYLVSSSGTLTEKSVQLGRKYSKDMEKAIIEAAAAIADFDIAEYAYSKVTTDDETTKDKNEAKPSEGDIVYITYKYTVHGAEKDEPEVSVSKERVVLDKTNAFHKALLENYFEVAEGAKKIGDTIANIEKLAVGEQSISYSDIKIEWVEKGKELTTYTEVTFDDEATDTAATKTDVMGKSVNLKNLELTYHIYPVSFISANVGAEYTATDLINTLFGSGISYTTVCQILFGYDYAEKTEDEIAALVAAYKFTEGDKEISLETFIESLANLAKTFETEKKDLTTAETELTKAKKSLKEAIDVVVNKAPDAEKNAFNAARDALEASTEADKTALEAAYNDAKDKAFAASTATDDEKGKVTTASDAVKVAENALTEAQTAYDTAKTARDAKVTALLALTDMEAKLTKGYVDYTYEKLEAAYITEVKMNLATEIYALLEKNVTISALPEKAVDEAYDQLIENYEYAFYNNQTLDNDKAGTDGEASNKDQSYYSIYKGSFKNFIKSCVVPNEYGKTPETYAEAKEIIRTEGAEKMVRPVLMVYLASEAYGLVIDDDAFEALAEEDSNYIVNEAYYGENTVRNAYQFDELMNHILAPTETTGTEDARFTKVTYALVPFALKAED